MAVAEWGLPSSLNRARLLERRSWRILSEGGRLAVQVGARIQRWGSRSRGGTGVCARCAHEGEPNLMANSDKIASPRRGSRLSRRLLLAGTAGAAAAVAFADRAGAQTGPSVPDDPTRVPGQPVAPVGMRSPFEHPVRLTPAPVPAFTPLEQLYGIITPSDLHYVIARGGTQLSTQRSTGC